MTFTEYEDIENPIQFCTDIILKEAKLENRIVKQLLLTMHSTYTNNPINLAINSPSGEGKNWVIKKVAEKFPQEDVFYLSGMTSKAIFHRHGINVIRDNQTGEYEPLDQKLAEIDSQIEEKEFEIRRITNKDSISILKGYIRDLEKDKSELKSQSMRLIDLSHKILLFLDTPPADLLYGIMSLLSHDQYESEYQYVDSQGAIGTKTNVLRGWPVVIFAQASDMSHYRRSQEIQRRFIFTNPRMDSEKYRAGIDLAIDNHGMPDFMYEATVLSQQESEKCKAIISQIKQEILEISSANRIREDKIQRVYIPFRAAMKSLIPDTKALDMTTANRLATFVSLISIINAKRRPRLVTNNDDNNSIDSSKRNSSNTITITPFALFEDLQEAIYLMESASGLRPFQLQWYQEVFLTTYREKNETPDFRFRKDKQVSEDIVAVTTAQLADKHKQVYKRVLNGQKILETYLEPLINEGYVDRANSIIDHRAYIYYPIQESVKMFDISDSDLDDKKLFENGESNNLLQHPRVIIRDPQSFPDKHHITLEIEGIVRYSIQQGLDMAIKDSNWKDLNIDELIDKYYGNPEKFFELGSKSKDDKYEPDKGN